MECRVPLIRNGLATKHLVLVPAVAIRITLLAAHASGTQTAHAPEQSHHCCCHASVHLKVDLFASHVHTGFAPPHHSCVSSELPNDQCAKCAGLQLATEQLPVVKTA